MLIAAGSCLPPEPYTRGGHSRSTAILLPLPIFAPRKQVEQPAPTPDQRMLRQGRAPAYRRPLPNTLARSAQSHPTPSPAHARTLLAGERTAVSDGSPPASA